MITCCKSLLDQQISVRWPCWKSPSDLLMIIHDTEVEFRDYSSQQQGAPRKGTSSHKQSTSTTKQDAASRFILAALQSGPRPPKDLKKDWEQQGGDRYSIRHAKDRLEGNRELRTTFDATGREVWELVDPLAELFQGSDPQDS